MNFYAVFYPTYEYKIFEGDIEIGGLDVKYAINLESGEDFQLAGNYWYVDEMLCLHYSTFNCILLHHEIFVSKFIVIVDGRLNNEKLNGE